MSDAYQIASYACLFEVFIHKNNYALPSPLIVAAHPAEMRCGEEMGRPARRYHCLDTDVDQGGSVCSYSACRLVAEAEEDVSLTDDVAGGYQAALHNLGHGNDSAAATIRLHLKPEMSRESNSQSRSAEERKMLNISKFRSSAHVVILGAADA